MRVVLALLVIGLLIAMAVGTGILEREERQKAVTAADLSFAAGEAYQRVGLERPWPELQIIGPKDELYSPYMVAQAAIYSSGRRALRINEAYLGLGHDRLFGVIGHEAAHFRIGELHGERFVTTHGPQWRELCREHFGPVDCKEEFH